MQKKLFMILLGLTLLFSFKATQTLAQGALIQPVAIMDSLKWSDPIYRPEVGDKIVGVNNTRIRNTSDFWNAVRSSPKKILLTIVDHRTGKKYYLRTLLRSPDSESRLGISASNSANNNGVIIRGVDPGTPGSRCQSLLEEGITPVYE